MSATNPPRVRPSVMLGMIEAGKRVTAKKSAVAPEMPLVRRREPYTIERHPAPAGWVKLVGFDRHGEYFSDWTIPAHRYGPITRSKFYRWLVTNDDSPELTLATSNASPELTLLPR